MEMLYFTRKDNGPTIEEYIQKHKLLWKNHWRTFVVCNFEDEAVTW